MKLGNCTTINSDEHNEVIPTTVKKVRGLKQKKEMTYLVHEVIQSPELIPRGGERRHILYLVIDGEDTEIHRILNVSRTDCQWGGIWRHITMLDKGNKRELGEG